MELWRRRLYHLDSDFCGVIQITFTLPFSVECKTHSEILINKELIKVRKMLICHLDDVSCAREDDGEWEEEVLGMWSWYE
jgi:hypothetical protein